jgi:hypothetical protein
MNPEIIAIELQFSFRVLRDDLKEIVLRNIQAIEHCLVHDQANLRAVLRGFAFEKIDSGERHVHSFNWDEIRGLHIDALAIDYGSSAPASVPLCYTF